MEQVRALHAQFGPEIYTILEKTFAIYTPLLVSNKNTILSIPRVEKPYGPHPRQKLDIYSSPSAPKDAPILVFFYGGGLIFGDKISPTVPDGLLYANLGSFFAARGITTILPDYRRVNSPFGGEDAVYPSGGEDVSLALKWIEENYIAEGEKREVFIMGNSAGGVHISTFLFEDVFLAQRKRYAKAEGGKIFLKGAVELAVPLHFGEAQQARADMLVNYYGSVEGSRGKCAYGLMEKLVGEGKSREDAAVPKVLCLVGEMDPEDEITRPMKEFVALWKEKWGEETIDLETLEGHNHISPPWALNAGEKEGEAWGEDLVKWLKK
ncbi:hypothetical protein G7Y89_g1789 [Cudoniella acicularis]|uniref:BD-FAE-like domain-containing protein n=1 Tax=Cudoniella acicularis TaxID=354080 RepID=A0A8H4RWJ8_9HELO|nr:hypothetical protein G7Y89_g1789 [Cudoniella acicularis]